MVNLGFTPNADNMIQKLNQLEQEARKLEPSGETRKQITQTASNYLDRFIEGLAEAPGYIPGNCELLPSFSLQEEGKSFEDILTVIKDEVNVLGINPAGGKHLGYIPGGGVWASAIGDLLAAATNRYAGVAFASPGAVKIENQLIQWMGSLLGYPEGCHGNLSSGGSISNLIAIKAARDHHRINSTNVRQAVIYMTDQAHHCIDKALHMTGLYEAVIRKIPMNESFQMESSLLAEKMEQDQKAGLMPFLVVATAGTTDTGAIDPLESIADACAKFGAWYHVDAAYGGFFLLVDEIKQKLKGIERSDSVVLDPHKTLFLPYGSGVVMVREAKHLIASNTQEAAYMQDAYGLEDLNPADSSPELSKHFRGLRMWLPLHLHGLNVFRANLEEKLLLCRYFHEEIAKRGFEAGPYPELSVALFRLPMDPDNSQNQAFVDELHADGRYFFSSTRIKGKLWIRCAVVSFRTHLKEIQEALEMIEELKIKVSEQS
jgi:aromatic-L-amino-acid/L-tryptophan decarboxylase